MEAKAVSALAKALAVFADASEQVDSKANSILTIVKEAGIRSEKTFTAAIKEAYAKNGWNSTAGRPKLGNRGSAVPTTVKQYVSRVRSAYRLGLSVVSYKTFHALRKAITEKEDSKAPRVANDPSMAGVRLIRTDGLLGAPFHDLATVFGKITKGERDTLIAEINRLIKKYAAGTNLKLIEKDAA